MSEAVSTAAVVRTAVGSGHDHQWRNDLQALRPVTVLELIAFHLAVAGLPESVVGVDLFFVLSGFVIFQFMLRELEENGRLNLVLFRAAVAVHIRAASAALGLIAICFSFANISESHPGVRAFLPKVGAVAPIYVIKPLTGEAEPDTDGREARKSPELLIALYLLARDGKIISLPPEY